MLSSIPRRGPRLRSTVAVLVLAFDLAAAGSANAQSNPLAWRAVGSAPSARVRHAMAHHAGASLTVMFGGVAGTTLLGDTWTWNGSGWVELEAAAAPSVRADAACAYDPVHGQLVLFGGSDGRALNDTWLFDGVRWNIATPRNKPSPRQSAAMAWDAARRELVLFGGRLADGTRSDETWVWDGREWRQRFPFAAPPGREGHCLAFDASGRLVTFGGLGTSGILDDTWQWDGQRWRRATTSQQPTPRWVHACATDGNGLVELAGGFDGLRTLSDQWSWDGSDWQPVSVSGLTAAFERGIAYHAAIGAIVVFGGSDARRQSNQTLLLRDGRLDWQVPAPVALPAERYSVGSGYDELRRVTVMFGGAGGTATSPIEYPETWTFDGAAWRLASTTGPVARSQSAMAWHRGRGTLILFGGLGVQSGVRHADTWEWNGTSWTQLAPSTVPPARFGHVMGTDGYTGDVVLFGGEGSTPFTRLSDTWIFRNGNWVPGPGGPSGRRNAALAHATNGLLLFGGLDVQNFRLADTWVFDGFQGAWSQQSPAQSPPARTDHAMAYDRQRGKTVLFGGQTFGVVYNDQWEWDGARWTQVQPSPLPAPRIGACCAYDRHRADVVLALGYTPGAGGGYVRDTWLGSGRPVTFGTYGQGCGGAWGVPYLDSGTLGPWLGWGFQVRINRLPPSGAVSALNIGFDPHRFGAFVLPLELTIINLPNCQVYVEPLVGLSPTTTIGSTAYYQFGIPNSATLEGLVFWAYGVVLDPSANGSITQSDAAMGRIGSR